MLKSVPQLFQLSKQSKYVIVGFPKCGQISLQKYLNDMGYDVTRQDNIWKSVARKEIEEQQPGRIPIIITRDPIQMIWSSYFYWHYKEMMSFQKYLKYKVFRESSLGNENPIDHADYEKHIAKFKDMNPIIFKFEEVVKLPNYPHENKTADKPQINQKFIDMIGEALESAKD